MKKSSVFKKSIIALLPISLGLGVLLGASRKEVKAVDGPSSSSTLPTTIDLKDNLPGEITSYYSSLENFTPSERQGTNLLKHLKEIIHDDIVYYPYGSISSAGVTQIYTITDRDWENSPASSIVGGTYNSGTNKITNYSHSAEKDADPYIKMLYVDYTRNGPTKFLNGTAASFDKEHVWSQSHGFKASSGATGPAGTDLHHLIAGEKAVNQQYHSNWSYGNVKVAEKEASAGSASTISPNFIISGNKLGTPVNSHSSDEISKVFEPNDSDKGRIARALLYMAACYNNYSGHETISQFDPNLELVDYVIDGGSSVDSISAPAKYGILSDLLEWNRTYLPDSFEIHRNNLIYNNYQFNRNPFIDYPEWADFIWGNADSGYQSTGYATPSTDTINGYNSGGGSDPVSVTGITLNTNSTSVQVGSTVSLTASVAPSNATNKGVSWTTSNSSIATVSDGVVTGVSEGTATITATTSDGGFTATCDVTVTAAPVSDPTDEGSVTAANGKLSGWTLSTSDSYSDGSVKFASAGDNAYKLDVFTGSVASRMKTLTVTVNGKINGTPTSANSYKVEALDSSGNVLASDVKTGSDVVSTSYGDTVFTISSGLTGCTGIRVTYVTKGGGNWGIKSISWSATYSSEQQEKVLDSISVKTAPTKTSYIAGQSFSPTGLVITATYSDASTSDIAYAGNESLFGFNPQNNLQTSDTSITITYGGKSCTQVITVAAKTLSSITINTDNVTKSFTKNSSFNSTGLVVTANFNDSSSSDVSSSATVSTPDMTTTGQKTVTVSYTFGGTTKTASYQITVTEAAPEKGSENNPYTVAEARSAIDTSGTLTDKYTEGIICKVDSYNSTYHSITYWISDDGVDQNALQIYGGLGLNGADFSSKDDLTVGDTVVIKGELTKYNTTYEYNLNSIIISITHATPVSDDANNYSLITNVSQLLTGDTVIIVGVNSSTYYTMSGISNNVMACTTLSTSNSDLIINSSTMTFTIEKSADGYRFRNSSNQYLATCSSKSNQCALESGTPTVNSLFNISYSNSTMSVVGVDGCTNRKTLQFNINSGGTPRFAFYTSASIAAVSIYKKTTQVSADAWSQTFLNSTSDGEVCNVNNWSSLASSYNALSDGAKSEIINVEANSSTYYSYRAQAMARYDYFMSNPKYNQGDHFIVGRASSLSNRPSIQFNENNSSDNLIFITICVVVSLTSLTTLLIIKKRKNIRA